MKDPHIYDQDETYRSYEEAKKRKDELKSEGYRVKIRKNEEGHVVYKKNVVLLDEQRDRHQGKPVRRRREQVS
jgi:hypothetical protein